MDEAVTALRRVRGIGEWTAQYVAMRALRFPDAFPAADLGVRVNDIAQATFDISRSSACRR